MTWEHLEEISIFILGGAFLVGEGHMGITSPAG